MHIETLRKHRKSLIKARREIKAKLELLDTLLEEAAVEAAAALQAAKVDHAEKMTRPLWVPAPLAPNATEADDIDAFAEDLIATWCPPTAAEWDAAKAYQTAARNAYRNATDDIGAAQSVTRHGAADPESVQDDTVDAFVFAFAPPDAEPAAAVWQRDWQRERRAIDLDDSVYRKTDMERQRATDTSPPAAPLEEAVRLHAAEIRVKTRYPGFELEWPADRRRSYENIDRMEACSPPAAPTRATAPPDGFLALAPYATTEASL